MYYCSEKLNSVDDSQYKTKGFVCGMTHYLLELTVQP